MILWESLSPGNQEKYLRELQKGANWVIWCKARPKVMATQTFRWIGSGPRTTLAGDANADIMTSIVECVRERVLKGARTFMSKSKHIEESLSTKKLTRRRKTHFIYHRKIDNEQQALRE